MVCRFIFSYFPLAEGRGLFGRQGSVNEIRLQIPTGADHPTTTRDGTTNKQLPPLMFLPKENGRNRKSLESQGNVVSQNELQVRTRWIKWIPCCFVCKKDRHVSRAQPMPENSSGGSLKAIREYHKNKKITRNHKRVMAVISSVLIVFTIGWCPYMIALFLYAMCDHCGINATILSGLLKLCVLQSFANFFIYFVKDATFKYRVKQIFRIGKDLGFMNRVAAAKSADQGMFGVAVTKRKIAGKGGAVVSGDKSVKHKGKKSDQNRLQLQSVS